MRLITGGAWQGKLDYVRRMFFKGTEDLLDVEVIRIADGETCTPDEMAHAQVLNHLNLWIRRQMEAVMTEAGFPTGGFAAELTEQMDLFDHQEMLLCQEKVEKTLQEILKENPDIILISDELGCGIIPMKAFDRRYRELVGRVCCSLAKEAAEVHRVVCGVGEVIKKTENAGDDGLTEEKEHAEVAEAPEEEKPDALTAQAEAEDPAAAEVPEGDEDALTAQAEEDGNTEAGTKG